MGRARTYPSVARHEFTIRTGEPDEILEEYQNLVRQHQRLLFELDQFSRKYGEVVDRSGAFARVDAITVLTRVQAMIEKASK